MSFIGRITDSIQERFRESSAKKKEEQEFVRRLQLQANVEKQRVFREEYLKNAKEVAIAQAKKEAAEKSGLQKLRAENRTRRLQDTESDDTLFGKLRDYTRKNMARREANLKRTEEMRAIAKNMREEKLQNQQRLRQTGFGRNG